MDWFQVVFLAVLQGVTEFLPISSSAHLILPSQLFGWTDQGLAFDVGVHIGSLTAVMIYFRQDIWRMIAAWTGSLAGRGKSTDSRLAWYVIWATLPAVVAGFIFNSAIDHYGRNILIIAGATLIFGALLWWADFSRTEVRPLEKITLRDAVIIGLAQAVALIPGTSRSGITITAGLMLGLNRQSAARFSFLLSIPVILGAGLLKGLELAQTGTPDQLTMVLSGAVLAAISAYACIHLFLQWLDKIGMLPFVIYRLLLGFALLGVYFIV
ncbi:undecaprenyl-diphosphate phosphatase [Amphritea sp. 2_MG-2023]|uniref:undecaprenyl-diphosphate phosphatase n=1 Tax=Amphritea TaxID=515417 RepID=UPI001C0678F1|nr:MULTISPECIES: undecaprenyl-diphosphate phosphatase [Amphritea]MBU2966164.1 undecaprenyl-diphosphate phosphatase [Amphritea atlantica]MDO6420825.1 undecaprenyl-diphosphate phosphatase [Amphritea sp. 2_MG-2023]MDX2421954.1 undecaprenyl-diphosphate phosphatase [Amphritea sp.]